MNYLPIEIYVHIKGMTQLSQIVDAIRKCATCCAHTQGTMPTSNPWAEGLVKPVTPTTTPAAPTITPNSNSGAQFVQIPGTDTNKKVIPGQLATVVIAHETLRQDDTIDTLINTLATKLTPTVEPTQL